MTSTTLIVTLGSSPAIITEALYALREENYPPVERIVILSTTHGIDRLHQTLLSTNGDSLGGFYRYCRQFGIPFHQIRFEGLERLEAIKGKDGVALADIGSVEDDEIVADAIFEKVKELTKNDDGVLVGLLSGGRKTMGTHLSTAFQLFARQQDKLIHVLVNDPFDRLSTFYYPHQDGGKLTPPWDRSLQYDPADAKINLIDVKFPRLRGLLPPFFQSTATRGELMSQIDRALGLAKKDPLQMIWIDMKNKGICINHPDNFIPIQERPLSIFAFFAGMNRMEGKVVELSLHQMVSEFENMYRLHMMYSRLVLGDLSRAEKEYRDMSIEELESKDDWVRWDYWHKDGVARKGAFSVKRTQLMGQIDRGLKSLGLHAEVRAEYLFRATVVRNSALRGLNKVVVPPEKIQWIGLDEPFWDAFVEGEWQ